MASKNSKFLALSFWQSIFGFFWKNVVIVGLLAGNSQGGCPPQAKILNSKFYRANEHEVAPSWGCMEAQPPLSYVSWLSGGCAKIKLFVGLEPATSQGRASLQHHRDDLPSNITGTSYTHPGRATYPALHCTARYNLEVILNGTYKYSTKLKT